MNEFTKKIIDLLHQIPPGKVVTYGILAKMAGSPRAARQVSWILHSSSQKYNLPWHRVISSQGKLSMKDLADCEEQANLLENEGIEVLPGFKINLMRYLWNVN
ncbi:MAG: MGMT family protein [Promethearchaeota archaeon]